MPETKKSQLPEELVRAWDRPSQTDRRSTRAKDEFVVGGGRRRVFGSRALLITAVVVLAGAGAYAATTGLGHHSTPGVSAPTAPQLPGAPGIYHAGPWVFTAKFPTNPVSVHAGARLGGKPYTLTTFSAAVGTSDTSVTVFPFPIGKLSTSADAFLRHFVSHDAAAPNGGTLKAGKSTRVQGFPALWIASTFDGGNSAMFGVVVLDGHVAWELMEMGPATTVTTSFQQELKSFRISDPGKAIVW
ncbi:MAG TPA: hypothetical protein VGP46_06540 [Acidimicrobiales bacterium]|nr:hypothetical protein [Acidimicrobiales bacterium]